MLDQYTHLAGMWLIGEDMPRVTNRVAQNPTLTIVNLAIGQANYISESLKAQRI
ncbi:MAG: hypothetical protein HHJ09_11645 [Glaciimonas sp.]|nr:hypothetical protein [Glaciimonas sp.]